MGEINLEKYYPGDDDWKDFSACFKDDWEECSFKKEIIKEVNGDEFLAMAIYGSFFETSMEWLEINVPALDDLTPKECLKSHSGILRLKTAIMRMPR